jgi:hypothetical protein
MTYRLYLTKFMPITGSIGAIGSALTRPPHSYVNIDHSGMRTGSCGVSVCNLIPDGENIVGLAGNLLTFRLLRSEYMPMVVGLVGAIGSGTRATLRDASAGRRRGYHPLTKANK